jgi:hypothetical protein
MRWSRALQIPATRFWQRWGLTANRIESPYKTCRPGVDHPSPVPAALIAVLLRYARSAQTADSSRPASAAAWMYQGCQRPTGFYLLQALLQSNAA